MSSPFSRNYYCMQNALDLRSRKDASPERKRAGPNVLGLHSKTPRWRLGLGKIPADCVTHVGVHSLQNGSRLANSILVGCMPGFRSGFERPSARSLITRCESAIHEAKAA